MESREAWLEGRPVFKRLPELGYQDNELVDAVTSWVDSELTTKANLLQQYHTYLNPETCPEDMLDYLAWLVGMSDSYWNKQWDSEVKREMIANAYWLFNHQGTLDAVKRVLDIHGYTYNVWTDGDLTLPFNLPGSFGTPRLRYYIRVNIAYSRNGKEWTEALKTIRNFSAATVLGKLSYQAFQLNYSRLGDPLFKV